MKLKTKHTVGVVTFVVVALTAILMGACADGPAASLEAGPEPVVAVPLPALPLADAEPVAEPAPFVWSDVPRDGRPPFVALATKAIVPMKPIIVPVADDPEAVAVYDGDVPVMVVNADEIPDDVK